MGQQRRAIYAYKTLLSVHMSRSAGIHVGPPHDPSKPVRESPPKCYGIHEFDIDPIELDRLIEIVKKLMSCKTVKLEGHGSRS